jgi:urea transport system permease protein
MTRILTLLLLLVAAIPARAQDAFVAALPGLAGNFNAQAEAVDRLGSLADPRALPVLRALSDGRLRDR